MINKEGLDLAISGCDVSKLKFLLFLRFVKKKYLNSSMRHNIRMSHVLPVSECVCHLYCWMLPREEVCLGAEGESNCCIFNLGIERMQGSAV